MCVIVCDKKPQQKGGLGASWAVTSQANVLRDETLRCKRITVQPGKD